MGLSVGLRDRLRRIQHSSSGLRVPAVAGYIRRRLQQDGFDGAAGELGVLGQQEGRGAGHNRRGALDKKAARQP